MRAVRRTGKQRAFFADFAAGVLTGCLTLAPVTPAFAEENKYSDGLKDLLKTADDAEDVEEAHIEAALSLIFNGSEYSMSLAVDRTDDSMLAGLTFSVPDAETSVNREYEVPGLMAKSAGTYWLNLPAVFEVFADEETPVPGAAADTLDIPRDHWIYYTESESDNELAIDIGDIDEDDIISCLDCFRFTSVGSLVTMEFNGAELADFLEMLEQLPWKQPVFRFEDSSPEAVRSLLDRYVQAVVLGINAAAPDTVSKEDVDAFYEELSQSSEQELTDMIMGFARGVLLESGAPAFLLPDEAAQEEESSLPDETQEGSDAGQAEDLTAADTEQPEGISASQLLRGLLQSGISAEGTLSAGRDAIAGTYAAELVLTVAPSASEGEETADETAAAETGTADLADINEGTIYPEELSDGFVIRAIITIEPLEDEVSFDEPDEKMSFEEVLSRATAAIYSMSLTEEE